MSPLIDTPTGGVWYAESRSPAQEDRPPLVLVHGAGGSHLHWSAQLRRLPLTRVLAVDLPGHGRSPGPGREEVGAYAQGVVELLNAIEIERAVVCGHSMGGAIALYLALEHSHRTAGAVLVGSGAKLRVASALLDGVLEHHELALQLFVDWSFSQEAPAELKQKGIEAMRDVDPRVLRGDLVACDRFDVRHRLGEIDKPVLVVGGAEDKMTPLRFSTYLQEHIASAKLHVVQGAGHMMALERPDEVASAVSDFVSQLEDRRPALGE